MSKRTVTGVRGRKKSFAATLPALGDSVSPEALMKEGSHAVELLRLGARCILNGELDDALSYFFKSAAIACNVTFTAKTHAVPLPDRYMDQMCLVTDKATHGIKKVMKMVAMKKMLDHEEVMHPGAG